MKHAIVIFLMAALGFLLTGCDDGLYECHNPEISWNPIEVDTTTNGDPDEPWCPLDTGTSGNGSGVVGGKNGGSPIAPK